MPVSILKTLGLFIGWLMVSLIPLIVFHYLVNPQVQKWKAKESYHDYFHTQDKYTLFGHPKYEITPWPIKYQQ